MHKKVKTKKCGYDFNKEIKYHNNFIKLRSLFEKSINDDNDNNFNNLKHNLK